MKGSVTIEVLQENSGATPPEYTVTLPDHDDVRANELVLPSDTEMKSQVMVDNTLILDFPPGTEFIVELDYGDKYDCATISVAD